MLYFPSVCYFMICEADCGLLLVKQFYYQEVGLYIVTSAQAVPCGNTGKIGLDSEDQLYFKSGILVSNQRKHSHCPWMFWNVHIIIKISYHTELYI